MTQNDNKGGFMDYLSSEVKKYRGIYVPVRSGLLRRLLVRHVACKKLHPNPDDEFCKPEIGPNFGIISNYQKELRNVKTWEKHCFEEKLIIERIRPDGYMLLNGHHRWAAAFICGIRKVPVKIVNLTQEMDVKRMLWNSEHSKRAALDLDEVVFCTDANEPMEKTLPFPLNRFSPHRLRLGIPGLFRYLNVKGYDVWVYSKNYYSLDSIRTLFRLYGVRVKGIVTGTARRRPGGQREQENIDKMIANHYSVTLSIDREALLRVDNQSKAFEEYRLSGSSDDWSAEVMDKIGSFDKDAK